LWQHIVNVSALATVLNWVCCGVVCSPRARFSKPSLPRDIERFKEQRLAKRWLRGKEGGVNHGYVPARLAKINLA